MDREKQWDRTITFLCYKNMQKKHTKAKITALKNTYFTEMLHIDISVVKPAATAQISLKFRGQKKNKKKTNPYSNTVGYHLFKLSLFAYGKRRKVARNWPHKVNLSELVAHVKT